MKPVSLSLKAHLSQEVTSLATCWKLSRREGVVLGFTSHSKDILYDEIIYKATTGFTPSSVKSHSGLAIDQLEIEAVIESGEIEEADIHAGLYDFAEIEIFMLNYLNVSDGSLILRRGWLGEIHYNSHFFTAEVRGVTQKLSQNIGELYSPRCRAGFTDERCGLSAEDYQTTSNVETVNSQREFMDSTLVADDGYYNYGLVTFTTGNNTGLSMEVMRYQSNIVELTLPMPYSFSSGDSYVITAGCDKRFSTCCDVFSNAINFRGEPHVPGNDKLLSGK